MCGAGRRVTFSQVVEKHEVLQMGAQEVDAETPWALPTKQEIRKRGMEVAEERLLVWEAPKWLHGLLALGLAAELRAEVEAGEQVRCGSFFDQDVADCDAHMMRDKSSSSHDAEDVESFTDLTSTRLDAEMRLKEICAGLTVFSDVHGQIIDIPTCWATGSVSNAHVAEASSFSDAFQLALPRGRRCGQVAI
eukprot:TRINITY_DN7554_c0_g1_i2.p1 TRINITY_DN7554_c0_g1~~TRINITY_DN7554_c0_g1_i2.p1  ORF type:complete len:220 (+),score=43.20 TRINITY_DN7554_c0_g1_i2:85-660(+)